MTRVQLRLRVVFVVLYLFALISVGLADKIYLTGNLYNAIKDFSGLLIAAAAAYLSYCFSKRQAHLSSLRELWKQAVSAKGELIQYTHLNEFSQKEFGKAHNAISSTIDQVRCVYRNVKETDEEIGLFPFEPLHDMRKCLERLGFVHVVPVNCKIVRRRMIVA